jgi:hypothetical protein
MLARTQIFDQPKIDFSERDISTDIDRHLNLNRTLNAVTFSGPTKSKFVNQATSQPLFMGCLV